MANYKFEINGKKYEVAVNGIEGNNADVCVNGVSYKVKMESDIPAASAAPVAQKADEPAATPTATPAAAPAGKGLVIKSPLPGVIISVDAKEGQAVKKGGKIAVIEAMKMENEILAEADGTVSEIYVAKGDSVLEGAKILKIA